MDAVGIPLQQLPQIRSWGDFETAMGTELRSKKSGQEQQQKQQHRKEVLGSGSSWRVFFSEMIAVFFLSKKRFFR